jgi:uncharacterized protein YdaU (DUF1376 family)
MTAPSRDAPVKLRGLMWWIDRWRTSSAYICMNIEQQGLYRNLLDTIVMFNGKPIPNDDKALITASGGDAKAWKRSGAVVLRWMQPVAGGWTNDTAIKVMEEGLALSQARGLSGRTGASRRWHKAWQTDGKPHGKPIAKS